MPLRRVSRFVLAVCLIGVAAVGIRVVAIGVWAQDLGLEGDQRIYHHQANDLADFVGYTYRHPAGERITTAIHPPLHTSLLGVASLAGASSEASHRGVGAVLGGLTAIVAGLGARRFALLALLGRAAGDVAGLVAAAAVAVAPTLWINDSGVLSESTYALTVALVLLAAGEVLARPSRLTAAALGGAVALAALTRAEAMALALLLVVPLLAIVGPRALAGRRRPRLATVGIGLLAFAVVVAPWLARNATSFERPVAMSSGAGFVLEIANCDETYYGERLGYWAVECDRTPWQAGDETATEAAKRSTGLAYARDNAGRLPVVVSARIARMWDLWRPEESVWLNDYFERRGEASSRWAIYTWWALLAGAVGGAWSLRRRPALLVPFAAVAASTTAAAAVSFGITRYRTGLEVAAALLAAVAVAALWSRWRTTREPADAQT